MDENSEIWKGELSYEGENTTKIDVRLKVIETEKVRKVDELLPRC